MSLQWKPKNIDRGFFICGLLLQTSYQDTLQGGTEEQFATKVL